MIYRGVKMTEEEQRKKSRRDWLKAVGIVMGVAAVVAAVVILTGKLGI